MIVAGAVRFFAETGFDGQTRELARRLGITQPLLYRYFPSKTALIERVYREVYVQRLDPGEEAALVERAVPLHDRLIRFYVHYANTILSYEWVRIYLWSGLREVGINARYQRIVRERIFAPVIAELRHAGGLPPLDQVPPREAEIELVWALHAAIFYLGVRKWVYGMAVPHDLTRQIEIMVAAFLDGVPKVMADLAAPARRA